MSQDFCTVLCIFYQTVFFITKICKMNSSQRDVSKKFQRGKWKLFWLTPAPSGLLWKQRGKWSTLYPGDHRHQAHHIQKQQFLIFFSFFSLFVCPVTVCQKSVNKIHALIGHLALFKRCYLKVTRNLSTNKLDMQKSYLAAWILQHLKMSWQTDWFISQLSRSKKFIFLNICSLIKCDLLKLYFLF